MLVRWLSLVLVISHVSAGWVLSAPPAREPAAVVYMSSLDGALDDIDYLAHAGGRPELSQQLTDLVAGLNSLQGIDRRQPFGIFAFLPIDIAAGNASPELVGFIPITDMDALEQTVVSSTSAAFFVSSMGVQNRYQLATARRTFQVLVDQGHILFTEKGELLDQPLPRPAMLTAPLSGQYDIVIQLRQPGVPKHVWDMVGVEAISASNRAIANWGQSTVEDAKLKVLAAELSRRALAAVVSEIRSVWLGLRVSRESRNAVVDLKFEFTKDGQVAKTLHGLASGPAAFARDADAHTPAGFHLHLTIPDEAKPLVDEVGRRIRKELEPGPTVADQQRANVTAMFDAVQQTVREGRYDVLAQFVGQTQGGMTLVVGVRTADGKKLSEAVTKILPSTVQRGDVAGIQLDAGEARGVRFSRIDQKLKDPDHERRIGVFYGSKPSLYLGVEPQTLWLLVGDHDALDDFSKVPKRAHRATATGPSSTMMQASIHLSDWMGLLSQTNGKRDRERTAAALAALKDPERDEVRLSVMSLSDGLQVSLSLDEAYLNLMSAAVLAE